MKASGRCEDGLEPILDVEDCNAAALTLGFHDSDGLATYDGALDWQIARPEGCTWVETNGANDGNLEMWYKGEKDCGTEGLSCICRRTTTPSAANNIVADGARVSEEVTDFWVSVDTANGRLAAGTGRNISRNEFMRLEVESNKTNLIPLSFAVMGGALWDFGSADKYETPSDGKYHTPPESSSVLKLGSVTFLHFGVKSIEDVRIGLFSTDMSEKLPVCSHVWEVIVQCGNLVALDGDPPRIGYVFPKCIVVGGCERPHRSISR